MCGRQEGGPLFWTDHQMTTHELIGSTCVPVLSLESSEVESVATFLGIGRLRSSMLPEMAVS